MNVESSRRQCADIYWMRQAISLAERGVGFTMPNPPVGAVVVSNGRIRGKGFHRRAGSAHAEVVALKAAGLYAKGACLYVTLEPCCTHGRTGPCTELIIKSGIRKIVVAARDPNPVHKGKGLSILKRAGIKIVEGVCREDAENLIKPFAKWITSGTPFITLKLGLSMDGRIADRNGRSKWITSAPSRTFVKKLRRQADAILIGSGTATKDNPGLLCNRDPKPFRIVVDSAGSLAMNSTLLNDAFADRTIVATTKSCSAATIRKYSQKGAQVLILPASSDGKVLMKALFSRLGKMGILHILCEGGGEIAYSLVSRNMVDEYYFFIAPIIIGGGNSVAGVAGPGWHLDSCPKLKFIQYGKCGDDIAVYAIPAGTKKV